jgi:glutathione S-transferase
MFGYGSYERTIDTLDKALAGRDYICGSRFTAADIYVGAQVIWGTSFSTIPRTPAFDAYAGRLRERSAYRDAKAIDDGLIAQSQAT